MASTRSKLGSVSTATKDDLAAWAEDPDWEVRELAALDERSPDSALRILARDTIACVRRAVAGNPAAPSEVLADLAREGFDAVAANPKAPPEVLETLARSGRWSTRMALAMNTATPPAILSALAHDKHVRVRINVAGNPALPPTDLVDVLLGLLPERGHYVRLWAATFPACPASVLSRLVSDGHRDVRAHARHHANTPMEFRAGPDEEPPVLGYVPLDSLLDSLLDD